MGARVGRTMASGVQDKGVGCSGKGSCGILESVGILTFGEVPSIWKKGEES